MTARRFVKTYRDRHGKTRRYFNRKGSKQIALPGAPGSVEFERAYLAALEASEGLVQLPPVDPDEITIARVVEEWERVKFPRVGASTVRGYRSNYREWLAQYGAAPIAEIEPHDVDGWLADRQQTPSAANNFLRRLRQICTFAVKRGYLRQDPTRFSEPFKIAGDGYHSWTDAEIEKFEKRWPIGSTPRLYLALLLYTGQRLGDVAAMTWAAISDGMIEVRQEKTAARLWIPMHADLRAVLGAVERRDSPAILTTDYGKPFSKKSLPGKMRRWCDAAQLGHCSSHGLRKACARRLAEAGCSSSEIMAITGHRSLREVDRYTRGVDQRKQASAAVLKMERKK